jgi:hypothetical protein
MRKAFASVLEVHQSLLAEMVVREVPAAHLGCHYRLGAGAER